MSYSAMKANTALGSPDASPERPPATPWHWRRYRNCESLHLSVVLPSIPRIVYLFMIVIYIHIVVVEAACGSRILIQWLYSFFLEGLKADFGFIVTSFSFHCMLLTSPLGYRSNTTPCAPVLIIAS